jgi:hypothetical protein
MSEEPKPPLRSWSVPALVLSVVVPGLLGLAAGAKVDEPLRPLLGPTGAGVAGFGTVFVVLVWFGVLSYRALTR